MFFKKVKQLKDRRNKETHLGSKSDYIKQTRTFGRKLSSTPHSDTRYLKKSKTNSCRNNRC